MKPTYVFILCLAISFFLCSLFYLSYQLANTNKGSIAIPAGNTYLGPSEIKPTPVVTTPTVSQIRNNKFTADPKTPRTTWTGKKFPYQFSYPTSLPLATFPSDPSDSVGVTWNGLKPEEHILINIVDLSKNKALTPFIKDPKDLMVNAWWRQFSGLTGLTPIVEFTNSKGLKGYKTRFINAKGETPNLDIFFEVPAHPELVIRVANGVLDDRVFDEIVDSVSWQKVQ